MEPINTNPKSSKSVPVNRVVLSNEATDLLDCWIQQMESFCPGIQLKRQGLVSWLVCNRDKQLSPSEMKAIKESLYDDIELATWVLKELKAAKARDEKLSLEDLLRGRSSGDVKKRTGKKRTSPHSNKEVPQNEGASSAAAGCSRRIAGEEKSAEKALHGKDEGVVV